MSGEPQRGADAAGGGRALDAAEADGFTRTSGSSVVDRVLYALFARHASDRRHDADRKRYRGTALDTGFETHLARVYGLSWLVCVAVIVPALLVAASTVPGLLAAADAWIGARSPVPIGSLSPERVAVVAAGLTGFLAKRATVRLGGLHLRWLTATRRTDIERTLPPAVRYLELLAAGSDGPRKMVEKAAANDAYGGTATSLRKALNAARLAGSLDEGLRRVARDTPSRELLAPFLLKFRKHAATGDAALAEYLRTESRMLAHRQDRARKRARRFLELLTELFVVVLVLPALLVIAATALTVVVPELLPPVDTPVGVVPTRAVVLYGAVVFLVAIGLVGAVAVGTLRPPNQRASYDLPAFPRKILASAGRNPSSAAVVCAPPAALLAVGLAFAGYTLVNVALLSYAAFAVPVGAVAGDAPGSTTRRTASWRTSSTPSRDTSRRGGRSPRRSRRSRATWTSACSTTTWPTSRSRSGRRPRRGVRGVRSVRETRGVRVRRHSRPASARPRSIGLSSASERRWPRGHSGSSPTP